MGAATGIMVCQVPVVVGSSGPLPSARCGCAIVFIHTVKSLEGEIEMAGARENNDLRQSFWGFPEGSGIFCKPHVQYRMADTSRMAGIKGSRSFHRRIEIGWVKNEPRGHTNLCRILSDPNVVRAAYTYKRPRSTPEDLAPSRDEGREP